VVFEGVEQPDRLHLAADDVVLRGEHLEALAVVLQVLCRLGAGSRIDLTKAMALTDGLDDRRR
jgi:hypothetical protein